MLLLNVWMLNRFNDAVKACEKELAIIDGLPAPLCADADVQAIRKLLIAQVKVGCGRRMFQAETVSHINEYLALLRQRGNPKIERRKLLVCRRFTDVVRRVVRDKKWTLPDIAKPDDPTMVCPTCNNADRSLFETDESFGRTCMACFASTRTVEAGRCQMDYARTTVVGKFVYNRLLHFQDCIKEFQGKQNVKIPDKVYSDLEAKLAAYHLLEDSPNLHVRFSRVTKQHIQTFLKGHVKHYENINIIFTTLTRKPVADIGHLEAKLVDDFKELVALYDQIHGKGKVDELDRRNFLSVQYVLFQLLRKHGYECSIDDFSVLKTPDRKQFHDKVCSALFEKLGWPFTPVF